MKQKLMASALFALVVFAAILYVILRPGRQPAPGKEAAPQAVEPTPAKKKAAPEIAASLPPANPGKAPPGPTGDTPFEAGPGLISGRVLAQESSSPLSAATVRAAPDSGRLNSGSVDWTSEGAADANGRFEIKGLRFAPYKLQASAPGRLAVELAGVFPGDPVELKLSRQDAIPCTLMLDGDDGTTPLPQQKVLLSVPDISWSFEAESAADGSIGITGILREELERARKDGRIECLVPGFADATVSAVPPGDAYRVSVEAGVTVEGLVLDARTGHPIPGALVHADSGHEVAADDRGSYRISGVTDDLTAYARGYSHHTMALDDAESGDVVRHDFHLKRGLTLKGTVKDLTGQPLPGFRVSIAPDAFDLESSSEKLEGRLIETYVSVSGPDGRYQLEGLNGEELGLPGDVELSVRAPGAPKGFSHDVEDLPEDSSEVEHDIVLDLQPLLAGKVQHANGEAVPRTAVYLESIDSDFLLAGGTDAQGAFGFKDVPRGRYRIRVEKNGQTLHIQELDVPSEALEIHLEELVTAAGTLVAEDTREAAPGFLVSLFSGPASPVQAAAEVATDPRGYFQLSGVPPGEYTLAARPGPNLEPFSRFAPKQSFPLTLGAGGWKGVLAYPVLPSAEVTLEFSLSSRGGETAPVPGAVWIHFTALPAPEGGAASPSKREPVLIQDAQLGYRARWHNGEYKLRFSTTVDGKALVKDEGITVSEGGAVRRTVTFAR